MVLNLWKNTTPCCAKHLPERVEMKFVTGEKVLSYKCPVCDNQITATDFERILNAISKIYVKRSQNAEWGKIVGEKFYVSKYIKCEIIDQTDDEKYCVSVINPKAGTIR